ncbi:MAG: GIY-YIG nuclease family protein [Spiribacter salinus]|uniref:GIY-YIG nuclease family protein n=1 Tax=Spiribacter salinus TaxID=1335746 RepID=A0A540V866_9GAMM|nr:MAG: GIY-YIG nuclease family protein [Spiribacter salinus]
MGRAGQAGQDRRAAAWAPRRPGRFRANQQAGQARGTAALPRGWRASMARASGSLRGSSGLPTASRRRPVVAPDQAAEGGGMSVSKIPQELLSTRYCKWRVYGLILEVDPGDFFVKIGVSKDVIGRVVTLRCALCVEPAVAYSPGTTQGHAFKTERGAHRRLSDYRTFGEWFRFSTKEKSVFHNAVKESWFDGDWRDAFSWSSLGRAALTEAVRCHASIYGTTSKTSAPRY